MLYNVMVTKPFFARRRGSPGKEDLSHPSRASERPGTPHLLVILAAHEPVQQAGAMKVVATTQLLHAMLIRHLVQAHGTHLHLNT